MVTSVDYPSCTAGIQKFCGGSLRSKQYRVKFNEIYLASANYAHNNTSYDDEDGIVLNNDNSNDADVNVPTATPPLRRSDRMRRQPDYLATDEIQRRQWPL